MIEKEKTEPRHGFPLIGRLGDSWLLYFRKARRDFVDVYLVAQGGRVGRYWLAWSLSLDRLIRDTNYRKLCRRYDPLLVERLLRPVLGAWHSGKATDAKPIPIGPEERPNAM